MREGNLKTPVDIKEQLFGNRPFQEEALTMNCALCMPSRQLNSCTPAVINHHLSKPKAEVV